jgi:hypothetical protein
VAISLIYGLGEQVKELRWNPAGIVIHGSLLSTNHDGSLARPYLSAALDFCKLLLEITPPFAELLI